MFDGAECVSVRLGYELRLDKDLDKEGNGLSVQHYTGVPRA
jgi:hypothetical protein